MRAWRRETASGLVVLVPILLCILLLGWIYRLLARLPILSGIQPPFLRVLVILLVSISVVMSTGYLMRTALGRVLDRKIEETMNQFPGIRLIYTSFKRTVETVLLRGDVGKAPVKVPMWGGTHMTAIRTGNFTADGREIVFVPGSPDLSGGFVVEVKPEDVVETGETLSSALIRLVSGGFAEERERDHDDSTVSGRGPKK